MRGSAIPSAQEGKSGFIYVVMCKRENHDRYIYLPLERQYNKGRLLLSFKATSTNSVDPDQTASAD